MRICIFAGGKIARSPLSSLVDDYAKRIPWPVEIVEFSASKKRDLAALNARLEENKKTGRAVTCALAVDGQAFSSEDLAEFFKKRIQHSINQILFIIGDDEGLDDEILDFADMKLSLGAMTWPHLLARVMLVEQIYRAAMILEGHPYHRA